MYKKKVTWRIKNEGSLTVDKFVKKIAKLLTRTNPDDYDVLKFAINYQNGVVHRRDINRRLDKSQRQYLRSFFNHPESDPESFLVEFVNFGSVQNVKLTVTGSMPFAHLSLIGENIPSWLHEMINRKFYDRLSWQQRLWSLFYNHRPFHYSLSR